MFRLDFLIALYIFCIAVAELMGAKTFPLLAIGDFKIHASVAIFVVPVIFTITDVIAEVYGRARARGVVRIGLVVIALLFAFAALATALPPTARSSATEAAYDTVFGASLRIALASLVAFAASEFLDVYIFTKLREKMAGKALWLRNNASNFAGFLVDSTLFITLAFYALDKPLGNNVIFLMGLIVPYWLLKCAMSALQTPLVYAGVRWLKAEKKVINASTSN